MKTKNIEQIAAPRPAHFVGDGFRVHNFIPGVPGMSMQRMDPFIMFDYNSKYHFGPSEIPRGVGVHPHKGFETVTIAYKGRVEHGDSSGGGGIIGEGDVQWMTAASGVLHKEFHETEWSKTGGEFQMVQLWVNLPAEAKKGQPQYQAIENAQMPHYTLADGQGFIEVIAGEYQGVKGPATTFTPIHMSNLKAKAGAQVTYEFPTTYNTLLLVLEGSIKVNGSDVQQDHVAVMAHDGEQFTVEVTADAVVLVLAGLPIKEPIAHYGPFVMNTQEELLQAFDDFNTGKFGTWN
ncbi:pirin family protein [Myroides odoratus]|uniref:Quercetin 2,3-dioxygenase n=1 Tax=Myroides odoratus TaxID=256 RepID=A0A378RRI2_MYROD|nr:pirin-like C-terminal cupin domain-containing protein [Myroides odoratus]MCS4239189.1 redox-sensitive bicupin YhaK (pirin superfamily) [Myroides odoratus]MDH6599506.1 redox-sensitive bicupin YhaK (pirin superfamily) [Myroides gitamensis]QQU04271.1 pirin family protein [Myroides odoratus]STZ28310.1 Quercetin 2,3-dioxygenase [Myroides odoratus]